MVAVWQVAPDQSVGMLLFEACHRFELPLQIWDRMAVEFVGACVDRQITVRQTGIVEGAQLQLTETIHQSRTIATDQLQLWNEWCGSKAPLYVCSHQEDQVLNVATYEQMSNTT